MPTPTFVVETGTGSATANSYTTVAYADQYLCEFEGDPATWTALTDTEKENYLRQASLFVTTNYSGRWTGDPKNYTQCLAWPRIWAETIDGAEIDCDSVPKQVQQAVSRMAYDILTTGIAATQPNVPLSDMNLRRKLDKVDVLTTEREYFAGLTGLSASGTAQFFTKVNSLLHPVLVPANSAARG